MKFYISLNKNGIPTGHYGIYAGINIGDQHSIVAVAEVGLYYWNNFFASPEQDVLLSYDWSKWPINREALPATKISATTKILNCAQYLLQQSQNRDNFSVWVYPYPFVYNTNKNWLSSHAQILAIQLLIRAYNLKKSENLLECFHKSVKAFFISVEDGGLSGTTSIGELWFEKFISKGNDNPRVLNGMMFVLIGLYDIFSLTKDIKIENIFNLGIKSLIKMIPYFDNGKWSTYDILGKPASAHYHRIHIKQLTLLHNITKEPILKEYADLFRRYDKT